MRLSAKLDRYGGAAAVNICWDNAGSSLTLWQKRDGAKLTISLSMTNLKRLLLFILQTKPVTGARCPFSPDTDDKIYLFSYLLGAGELSLQSALNKRDIIFFSSKATEEFVDLSMFLIEKFTSTQFSAGEMVAFLHTVLN